MAKVLISSLGTGNKKKGSYSKAKYGIEGQTYDTSFIADALHQHLKFDTIFLIGTKKSIRDEAYTAFGGENEKHQETFYEEQEKSKVSKELLENFNLDTINPILV